MKTKTVISVCVAAISFLLVFYDISFGFENKYNNGADYSREGAFLGGHDTITAEAGAIKATVHRTDPSFTKWLTTQYALHFFRTGVHDEDQYFPWERVEGPNGRGNFWKHFYNPDTGKGLYGQHTPATERARDYALTAKGMYCTVGSVEKLPVTERNKFHDYLGRAMHLLQDMAAPSHTTDDGHVLEKPFELYVQDHWRDVVNLPAFQERVTAANYRKGGFEQCDGFYPRKLMLSLANISHTYPNEEQLYDMVPCPPAYHLCPVVNQERLRRNVEDLVPEAILYTAGYIDCVYKALSQPFEVFCDPRAYVPPGDGRGSPGLPGGPGGETPDDRFDVSDEFYWHREFGISAEQLTDLHLKTALKKGKAGVWLRKILGDMYEEGRSKYSEAPDEVKWQFERAFKAVGAKLAGRPSGDWDGAPDVALFAYGLHDAAIDLMLRLGEPVRFLGLDFDPAIAKDQPVMLVPSGGFSGMENSTLLKAKLDEYVKNGGTLVVLSQQKGSNWELLPAPADQATGKASPVTGFGYQQDQSCQFASVTVEGDHPILSVFPSATADIGVDGYFTAYPAGTEVLLRRTVNGEPAMILYPYGKGYVVAGTFYTDFAATHSQATEQEIAFLGGVIQWAKKPAELPVAKPGDEIDLALTVTNFADNPASTVKLLVVGPDRNRPPSAYDQSLGLPAGGEAQVTFRYRVPDPGSLGIYHIEYVLYDGAGSVLQPRTETDAARFAVATREKGETPTAEILFSVSTTSQEVLYGADCDYTFHIRNLSNRPRTLRIENFFRHTKRTKTWNVSVEPSSQTTAFGSDPFIDGWYMFETMEARLYDEENKQIGQAALMFRAIAQSQLEVDVYTGSTTYEPGSPVTTSVRVKAGSLAEGASIVVRVVDATNAVIFTWEDRRIIPAEGLQIEVPAYQLSLTARAGSYSVTAQAADAEGKIIGSGAAGFEVVRQTLAVSPQIPEVFNQTTLLNFTVMNIGRATVASAELTVELRSPQGVISAQRAATVPSLEPGATTSIQVSLETRNLAFGDHTLVYSLAYGEERSRGSITLPNRVAVDTELAKATYRVREKVGLYIKLANVGRFDAPDLKLALDAPTLGYASQYSLGVGGGATASFKIEIEVLPDVLPGGHEIAVVLSGADGPAIRKAHTISILESSLRVALQGSANADAGGVLVITAENEGGVDTAYEIERFDLVDLKGITVASGGGSGTVTAGGKTDVNLAVPGQAASGKTFLEVEIKDSRTGRKTHLEETVWVRGLSLSMVAATSKEAYLPHESIQGNVEIVTDDNRGVDRALLAVSIETLRYEADEFHEFVPRGNWVGFYQPTEVAVDEEGNVFVADSGNYQIKKFDRQGRLLKKWGRRGKQNGEFTSLGGIALGPDGLLYVASSGEGWLQVFDRGGAFVARRGTCGSEPGQVCYPMAIAISPANEVVVYHVSDPGRGRIARFDPDGRFLTEWLCRAAGLAFDKEGFLYATDSSTGQVAKYSVDGQLAGQWGSQGTGLGQLQQPWGIALDGDGLVYVADSGNNRIQKFDSQGNPLAEYGVQGKGPRQFQYPSGVAVAADGTIYGADTGNNRIQVLSRGGTFEALWGGLIDGQFLNPATVALGLDGSVYVADMDNDRIQKFDSQGNFLLKWGERGEEPGMFNRPYGVVVGPGGSIYVSDSNNSRIQVFDSSGRVLAVWESWDGENWRFSEPVGLAFAADGLVVVADAGDDRIIVLDRNGNILRFWGEWGSGDDQVSSPSSVAMSSDGLIYVADTYNHRVHVFDLDGRHVLKWGSRGTEDGAFEYPEGVTIDRNGFVYVADTGNHRIQKFDLSGDHLGTWGSYGNNEGEFYFPTSVAVRNDGSLVVVDLGNHRVQWLPASGNASKETLFSAEIPIDQASGTSAKLTVPIGLLNRSGKFTLKARLRNSLGQVLATSDYPFYVSRDGFVTLLRKAKEIYRAGEPVVLEGEIRNLTEFPKVSLTLSLSDGTPSGTSVLYEKTVDVLPNSSQSFAYTLDSPSVGAHIVKASVSDGSTVVVEAMDAFRVVEPSVEVAVEVGAEIGCATIPVEMVVKNKGVIAATVHLTPSFDGKIRTVSTEPGEQWTERFEVPTTASDEIVVQVTGDLATTITRAVVSGCKVQASIQVQPGYLEGPVTIPFVITNTGTEDLDLAVEARLDPSGTWQTKPYFIPKGGTTSDEYSAGLPPGEYKLALRSTVPALYQEVTFTVRPEKKAALGPLLIGPQSEGRISVSTQVTNEGAASLEGAVVCSILTAQGGMVWTDSRSVTLGAAPLRNQEAAAFEVDVTGWTPSEYAVTVDFVDGAGQILATVSGQIVVRGMMAELVSAPAYRVVQAGEEASFAFVVRNAGMQGGLVTFSFSSLDLIASTQSAWFAAGAEKTFLFRIRTPEDQEEKDIWADYTLKAGDQHLKGMYRFRCAGISLMVSGRLDKARYRPGETAGLTLDIEAPSGTAARDLFARVNYGNHSDRKTFRLEDKATLSFEVPLVAITGEKLFFGVYDLTGKALHLNSVYVYAVDDELNIDLNRQVFKPGETVEMTVKGAYGGTLMVSAPGLNETVTFTGRMNRQFTLPAHMKAGTYRVEAVLEAPDGTRLNAARPFDVEGLTVKVKNAVLNKSLVGPQDIIGLTLDIESNMSVGAILRLWTEDPDKAATFLGENALSLEGGTRIRTAQEYPFSTTRAGTHRIIYAIYSSNIVACTGSVSFDVGRAALLALTAEPAGPAGAQGTVIVKTSLLALVPATLSIEVDGALVEHRAIGAQGYVSVVTTVSDMKPGAHTVRGIVRSETLENVKEAKVFLSANLADLVVETPAKGAKPDKQGVVSLTFTARNTGGAAAAQTEVAFYEDDGTKKVYQIPPLAPGQAAPVEYAYNAFGKAGEHLVRAVIDPENKVPERNEDNNSAESKFSLPGLLLFTESPKETYKTRETVDITTTILSFNRGLLDQNFVLLTSIRGPSGEEVFQRQETLTAASPEKAIVTNFWETSGILVEGRYAVSQSLARDGQVAAENTLQINLVKARDFVVSCDVERTYLKRGQTGKALAHILPVNGWTSEVTVDIGEAPPGLVVAVEPVTCVPPSDVLLAMAATDTAVPGLYTLRLGWSGVDEGEIVRHSTEAAVHISGFAIEPEAADITVRQLDTATVAINVLGLGNYSGDLAASHSPTTIKGLTMRIDKTSVAVPGSLRLLIETARYAKAGTYPVEISATDGYSTQTAHLTLNIAHNPSLTWQLAGTPGPGYSNPALVSIIGHDYLRLNEFKAFDFRYGANAVMADVDGDGEDEIVVAPGPDSRASGTIQIYRKDGGLVLQQQLSAARYGLVLAKGDLDGDWKEEIIVANPLSLLSTPNVRAYSLERGRLVETGVNFAPFPWTKKAFLSILDYGIGLSLAAGDVDGDGRSEIIVGSGLGLHDEARVRVFRVDTTGEVGQWKAGPMLADFAVDFLDGHWYSLGVNVAAGDLDGDGIDEIVAGAGAEPCARPMVQVFRGDGTPVGDAFNAYPDNVSPDGKTTAAFSALLGCPAEPGYHSGVTVAAGDLDGDGVAEIITGLGPSPLNPSWVRIFNGDGTLFHDGFLAFPEAMKYGVKVSVGRIVKE